MVWVFACVHQPALLIQSQGDYYVQAMSLNEHTHTHTQFKQIIVLSLRLVENSNNIIIL